MRELDHGWQQLRAGEWEAARDTFASELHSHPGDPEAIDGLSEAVWWLYERDRSTALRHEAFVAYRRRSDTRNAGRIATRLAGEERIDGRAAVASGWLARARRLLADDEAIPERGWLEIEEAKSADDATASEAHARAALALATELADHDIECMALAQLGGALVRQGRVAEGVMLLDEAMTIALGGESSDPTACGDAACTALVACVGLDDLRRAAEWCEAVVEFTERRRFVPLQSWCRAIYASVLIRSGDWPRAEAVLTDALEHENDARRRSRRALPLATLAELRLRQGRMEEAATLLEGIDDAIGVPQRVRSNLARGDADRARVILDRGRPVLTSVDEAVLDGEVARVCGDTAASDVAAARLAELGDALNRDDVRALAAYTGGRVALERGNGEEALDLLGAAVDAFSRLRYPLEEGRARLELARAYAAGEAASGLEEARRARDVFERLGARADADAAAAVLRGLGAAGRSTARVGRGDLTARETEVLRLVATGLSNAEIAQRLVITSKTAEHHVSRVLAKLGVRSRAEAAAHAVREGI